MLTLTPIQEYRQIRFPRRILKYVLVWCTEGNLTVVVDETEFLLSANDILTITSGQIHHIKQNHEGKGQVMEFTLDFFCKNDNDIELIFHNGLFCHFAMNEVIPVNNPNTVNQQLKFIKEELDTKPYQYLNSIHSRIELILISVNRSKIARGDEIYKPDALFLKFLELIRNNFTRNYSTKDAADILGTTDSKLNELSKLHTGKTAQKVIYSLIISEAKRLFSYEKLSVKEVAYKLGFNDPFYFSNFFKKHTRLSPSEFKEQVL